MVLGRAYISDYVINTIKTKTIVVISTKKIYYTRIRNMKTFSNDI